MAPYVAPSTPAHVRLLLQKIDDADPDIRFMTLNDLFTTLSHGSPLFMSTDHKVEDELGEKILRKLDDQNGDVQNQAIKCLGVLAPKISAQGQMSLLGKLTNFTTANSIDGSMRTTAMRTIITTFENLQPHGQSPNPSQAAYGPISKTLVPYLYGTALKQPPSAFDPNVLDVAIDLVRVFGQFISEIDMSSILKPLSNIVNNELMPVLTRKKAVNAVAILATVLPDRQLSPFMTKSAETLKSPKCPIRTRRFLTALFGSLARSLHHKMAPFAKTITPLILDTLSDEAYQASLDQLAESGSPDEEADDVFEASLTAMEEFISCLGKELKAFIPDLVDTALRFLNYDPNMAVNEDADAEMVDALDEDMPDDNDDGFENEEDLDYEGEGNESDDDDSSWKIRRCAIKILKAAITSKGQADLIDPVELYQKIAPALLRRFIEREESVRLEVIETLAQLVRQTEGEHFPLQNGVSVHDGQTTLPTRSRKRRRDSGDINVAASQSVIFGGPGIDSPALSPSPTSGPRADLAQLTPKIVQSAQGILKQKQPSTKVAAISLLRDLAITQPGALSASLQGLRESLISALQSSGPSTHLSTLSSNANASGGLRVETLRLLTVVCENHSSKIVAPSVEGMVMSVVAAAKDRMARVAIEAINTLESITKAFTPPRSAGTDRAYYKSVDSIYDALFDLARQTDADLEIRQRAIVALGVMVARASTNGKIRILPQGKTFSALGVLAERLRNETTRVAAIQAIAAFAGVISSQEEVQDAWIADVLVELSNQLRKADRLLRDTSLLAIKSIILNNSIGTRLNANTARMLTQALLPLVNGDELNNSVIALTVLAKLAHFHIPEVVNSEVVRQVSELTRKALSGPALDAVANFAKSIGEQRCGQTLMSNLLQQGTRGDPSVTGRVIGTLLVYGSGTVGVSIEDFAKELDIGDEARVCLALSILGEAGLLYGPQAPTILQPKIFVKYLKSRSDQISRAAAVAMGRAAVGNKALYLPTITQFAGEKNGMKYLALHALREVLLSANRTEVDITADVAVIWDAIMMASSSQDNQVLGAECLGRLALADPGRFLPQLQNMLQDPYSTTRGLAIQAIRAVFPHHSESTDDVLRYRVVQMLTYMLNDSDLANRRLGLGALNSATQHLSGLVLPHIPVLLPYVIQESKIKPELIREVQMGPFKHKVDDGLEVRKSAYETLYTFMERDYGRLNNTDFYDRVIAGLGDDHEIKMLCNLMITKLIKLDPDETVRRLDEIAEQYRAILSVKLKDNAVKQEYEKDDSIKKGVQKMSITLKNTFPQCTNSSDIDSHGQNWRSYWQWLNRDFKSQLTVLEAELYQQGAL